jgi:hypothetical protein
MLGCVLGYGGYRDEALDRLAQAMRASPNVPVEEHFSMIARNGLAFDPATIADIVKRSQKCDQARQHREEAHT